MAMIYIQVAHGCRGHHTIGVRLVSKRWLQALRARPRGGPKGVASCRGRRAWRAHPLSRIAGTCEDVVPKHFAPGGEPCPADVVTDEAVLLRVGLPESHDTAVSYNRVYKEENYMTETKKVICFYSFSHAKWHHAVELNR